MLLDKGIEVYMRHVKKTDTQNLVTEMKKENAFKMLLNVKLDLLSNLFRECRYITELSNM